MTETSCPQETHSAHLCPAPPHPDTVRKIASDRARNRYKESHFFVKYNGTTRSYRPTTQNSLRLNFIVLFCFHEAIFYNDIQKLLLLALHHFIISSERS